MSQRLYVELDCLLDTRLATLIHLNESWASQVVQEDYRERRSDNWQHLGVDVPWETYQAAYSARDGDVLKLAKLTNLAPLLNHITNELEKNIQNAPMVGRVEVEVNLYPYVCAEPVQAAIRDAVQYMLSSDAMVTVTYLPLETLTPTQIDHRWDAVVQYDFNAWLNQHHTALKAKPLPRILFISPALLLPEVSPTEEIYVEGISTPLSPFAALEMQLVDYVSLRLLDAKYFSLVSL